MLTAVQAHQQANPGAAVIGWRLDPGQRAELLSRFAPKYVNAVANHVTLKGGVDSQSALPEESQGEIIGRSDDGLGVEAMVVRIGGTTDRPGGGTYHITWSLADGREASESNDVIAARKWQPFDKPVGVQLQPSCFTWPPQDPALRPDRAR